MVDLLLVAVGARERNIVHNWYRVDGGCMGTPLSLLETGKDLRSLHVFEVQNTKNGFESRLESYSRKLHH